MLPIIDVLKSMTLPRSYPCQGPLDADCLEEREEGIISPFEGSIGLYEKASTLFSDLVKLQGISCLEPKEIIPKIQDLYKELTTVYHAIQEKSERNPYRYWTTQIGLGDHIKLINWLSKLSGELINRWKNYLSRCEKVARDRFAKGILEEAKKRYECLAEVAPKITLFAEAIADCETASGSLERAAEIYFNLQEKNSRSTVLYSKYLSIQIRLGKAKETKLRELSDFDCDVATLLELVLRHVEIETQKGNYLGAIAQINSRLDLAINVDPLRLKLIDVYLAAGGQDNGDLFYRNINFLIKQFSKQSCYSAFSTSIHENLQIVIDFFDYVAKRSIIAPAIFYEYLRQNIIHVDITTILEACADRMNTVISICDNFFTALDKVERTMGGYNLQQLYEIRKELSAYVAALHGGGESFFVKEIPVPPVGLIAYCRFYGSLLDSIQDSPYKISDQAAILSQYATVKGALYSLLKKLHGWTEDPRYKGLIERIDQRIALLQVDVEEEIPTTEWIKRGNLIKFIGHYLVPREYQNEIIKYLEDNGIDLERLFSSELSRFATSTHVLAEGKEEKLKTRFDDLKIVNLETLKEFINK